MELTKAQRDALDALPAKRRAFVLAYLGEAQGNAMEAARLAGYASPDPEGARLLGNDRVRAAIEALRAPLESDQIASIEELRRFWTTITRGDVGARMEHRLKATELLGKSQGAFVERREVKHEGGAILLFGSIREAADAARQRKGG